MKIPHVRFLLLAALAVLALGVMPAGCAALGDPEVSRQQINRVDSDIAAIVHQIDRIDASLSVMSEDDPGRPVLESKRERLASYLVEGRALKKDLEDEETASHERQKYTPDLDDWGPVLQTLPYGIGTIIGLFGVGYASYQKARSAKNEKRATQLGQNVRRELESATPEKKKEIAAGLDVDTQQFVVNTAPKSPPLLEPASSMEPKAGEGVS